MWGPTVWGPTVWGPTAPATDFGSRHYGTCLLTLHRGKETLNSSGYIRKEGPQIGLPISARAIRVLARAPSVGAYSVGAYSVGAYSVGAYSSVNQFRLEVQGY